MGYADKIRMILKFVRLYSIYYHADKYYEKRSIIIEKTVNMLILLSKKIKDFIDNDEIKGTLLGRLSQEICKYDPFSVYTYNNNGPQLIYDELKNRIDFFNDFFIEKY
jgi:hypothetical protein